MPDSQPFNQDVFDKAHSRIAAESLIETQAKHHVDTLGQQFLEFLSEGHQPRRRLLALEKLPGLGLENHHHGRHAKRFGLAFDLVNNGFVPQVHTIKITDGRDTPIGERRVLPPGQLFQVGQAPDQTHAMRTFNCQLAFSAYLLPQRW